MAEDKARRPQVARLKPDLEAELLPLAKQETEGNLSLLVRRLLWEALDARKRNAQKLAS